jgi:hypothetical protein
MVPETQENFNGFAQNALLQRLVRFIGANGS